MEDEPELFEDIIPYWEAYGDLGHSRQIGMAIGPIPLSEIAAYLALFPGLDAEFLVRFVRELDVVFLEYHAAKSKLKQSPRPAAPRPSPVSRRQLSGHR